MFYSFIRYKVYCGSRGRRDRDRIVVGFTEWQGGANCFFLGKTRSVLLCAQSRTGAEPTCE